MRTVSMLLLSVSLPLLAGRCEDLLKVKLPHVTVDVTDVTAGGTFAKFDGLPRFGRVAFTSRPSGDSEIRSELWLPEQNWNGRLEGTGNEALAGHINYPPLGLGVKHGYAVVNTDMGLATATGQNADLFVGGPERWKDWGYRATHEMTVAAKLLVKAYYEQPLKLNSIRKIMTGWTGAKEGGIEGE